MLKHLLACGLVACPVGSGSAAPPAWEARYGVTADDFVKADKELAEKGFRPAQICAANTGKGVRFTAVWEKRPDGPELGARYDLTAKELEAAAAEFKDKGFRPVDVCGYESGGAARFAAVWEQAPKDAPARAARHDLTGDDYRKLYADLTKDGFRPLRVTGYAVGKETRYATVWEKEPKNGPAWHARRDLTPAQYQDEFDAQRELKRRPVHVCGYTVDGEERFAAVWEASAAPGWTARHGGELPAFEKSAADLKANGYRPLHISGYAVGDKLRFAFVWVRD